MLGSIVRSKSTQQTRETRRKRESEMERDYMIILSDGVEIYIGWDAFEYATLLR